MVHTSLFLTQVLLKCNVSSTVLFFTSNFRDMEVPRASDFSVTNKEQCKKKKKKSNFIFQFLRLHGKVSKRFFISSFFSLCSKVYCRNRLFLFCQLLFHPIQNFFCSLKTTHIVFGRIMSAKCTIYKEPSIFKMLCSILAISYPLKSTPESKTILLLSEKLSCWAIALDAPICYNNSAIWYMRITCRW